jgi:hypothetical protein
LCALTGSKTNKGCEKSSGRYYLTYIQVRADFDKRVGKLLKKKSSSDENEAL